MKKIVAMSLIAVSLFANDIIVKESCVSVDATVKNIQNIVSAKGLDVFSIIDHGANAKAVDMKFNESKMIIFGNAKLGTALMQQNMALGLDLPLRVLVYKDVDSKVKMAYRDGLWLQKEHLLNAPKKITKVNKAMDNITTKAGQCLKD